MKEIRIPVLLEHYEGEEAWTATVPQIDRCLAEGADKEEAKGKIVRQIQDFIDDDPALLQDLDNVPEMEIEYVNVPIGNQNTNNTHAQHSP